MRLNNLNRQQFSWALYDWANSAFATTVMAGFFPIFFKQYWSSSTNISESSYQLGLANSLSSLLLALLAPYLGALADQSHKKKKFLAFFLLMGSFSTFGFYFVGQGQWVLAIFLYTLATMGFLGGNTFYDSLISKVSTPQNIDIVSGLGYSLGYLGGGVLFLVNVLMTLHPQIFGLSNAAEAVQLSFVMVAVWWLLFSIPLFLYVPETPQKKSEIRFVDGFKQLLKTLKELISKKKIWLFLISYLFYIDGVNTIIKMAVDYGLSLGFDSQNLIQALLITQFVGFPAALIFGYLAQKWSPLLGIYICIFVYTGITLWSYQMNSPGEFYILAATVGLVQGGIQALSRSHFARMVPHNKEAEYFGLFNMMGKTSAILGPVLVGWTSFATSDPRLSILVILGFFALGSLFLILHAKEKPQIS